MPPFVTPPLWTDEQLKAMRDVGEQRSRELRRLEGPRAFAAMCEQLAPRVRRGMELTNDLRELTGEVFRTDPSLWTMFRYVCAPPISQEDFWTLVGGPKFRTVPEAYADDAAAALVDVVDPVRFAWVWAGRDATVVERDAAILATTCLWASQELSTTRRRTASASQEALVGEALTNAGFVQDAARARIDLSDAMERGHFSKERVLAGAKCDVPVRLRDGRLLAIECKVSNGPKNGWKRLNREVVGKSGHWRNSFGNQVLTAAVIDGVFDLAALRTARDDGVWIIYGHDLTPLTDFVLGAV